MQTKIKALEKGGKKTKMKQEQRPNRVKIWSL
jgi:hypothetical protein